VERHLPGFAEPGTGAAAAAAAANVHRPGSRLRAPTPEQTTVVEPGLDDEDPSEIAPGRRRKTAK